MYNHLLFNFRIFSGHIDLKSFSNCRVFLAYKSRGAHVRSVFANRDLGSSLIELSSWHENKILNLGEVIGLEVDLGVGTLCSSLIMR